MLQNLPPFNSSLKLLKYSESLASPASTQEDLVPYKPKIHPIPVLHIKSQNNANLRRSFVVHGHKYHSKVSASGPETPQILKGIRRSQSLKFVRNFEFDPYLCGESHIGLLNQALTKLQNSNGMNLVIRRLEKSDEITKLKYGVSRLQRLHRLRLELPRTQNISDKALVDLGNIISRCYSLQEVDHATLNLENISERAYLKCSKKSKKLVHIRKMKRVMQKTEILNNLCCIPSSQRSTFMRLHLQSIDLSFGIPTAWCSMSTETDESSMLMLRTITWHQELKNLKLQFTGNPAVLETMQILSETVPKVQSLRKFSLELLNSRVTESEMFAMIQMIPHITQIEELTFKVIQYPNVEIACILCLVGRLAMYKNFKKIALYFRRLNIDADEMREVIERVQSLSGMNCVPGKGSLYIYKDTCDEKKMFMNDELEFEEML